MSPWSIILFVLMLAAAAVTAWRSETPPLTDEPDPTAPADPRTERLAMGLFHWFGIGHIPLGLALAVLLSTAAVAGLALDALAAIHLGAAYPSWFPANAVTTGLGVGLLSTRMLASSYPPEE